MKYLIFFVLLSIFLSSCSPGLTQSYSQLSSYEKKWVLFHPFKAKRAYTTTHEVEAFVDSLQVAKTVGVDINGGHLDAFKHSYWMASLTRQIGAKSAEKLGIAHEKGNYEHFLKHQLEDGVLGDAPSSKMDLYNNKVGVLTGKFFRKETKASIVTALLDSLAKGRMKIIKKDDAGNFLDCKGAIIPLDSLKKWDTKKCLVPSNFQILKK